MPRVGFSDDLEALRLQIEVMGLADNVTGRFAAVQEAWSAVDIEPLKLLSIADPLVEFAWVTTHRSWLVDCNTW